ncbi:type 4a pilus biogenesis protein PilO [Euzebya sp.]|uniref:type 4a pilus biogenesis protein PilO n=1 Tax=Euzebya sp. TaxID=1971409 RepID=UPI00351874AB
MRQLIVGLVLLAIASLVGWWFLLYNPAREQRNALDAEIVQLETQETTLTNQLAQLRSLQERAPELQAALDRLGAYIPPQPDQATLLDLLQEAGNASGLTFTSLNFTDPTAIEGAPATRIPGTTLGAVTVTGTVEGTYFQMVDFLRRLEVGSSRAVLVTSVNMTEAEDGFPELTAAFSADIYMLVRAPVADVPPDTTTPTPTNEASPAASPTAADATPTATDPAQSGGTTNPDGEVQVQ